MAAPAPTGRPLCCSRWWKVTTFGHQTQFLPRSPRPCTCSSRPSQSMACSNDDRVFKQLGMYSLKKRIEDAISRVEMITSTALEMEEAWRTQQERVVNETNLWDNSAGSEESLSALADAVKAIDDLKDMRYKAEEAKLIMQLAEMEVVNDQWFEQAYATTLEVSNFLDCYEMSKLLKGPYDKQGACLMIRAGPEAAVSEFWVEKLAGMYKKWAEKHGFSARVVENYLKSSDMSALLTTIEFESRYMYGYLRGEEAIHSMVHCPGDSANREACSAAVDVVPLFLDGAVDTDIDGADLEILPSSRANDPSATILHIPTGIRIDSAGERTFFANKMKAQSRLKAKLLSKSAGDGAPNVREYFPRPQNFVSDLLTGIRLQDTTSVLDGNIENFIQGHINLRAAADHS